ncbi:MAG: hypothetical protein ACI317_08865 [Floccifex porci]|uniref:NADH dehydrogenase subunit 6 n=1 Tax=Floccifex porci TaxID=2606629 RepID=A0A7X2N4L1_9FIRM|nr:hypothetical protein [Floccifex porci]MDD7466946.1 hypothetical protein [Floccifex porci]MSS01943.1 hypothetical protein [Floccifex porci]
MKKDNLLSKACLLVFTFFIAFALLYVSFSFWMSGKKGWAIGLILVTILLLIGSYLQLSIRTDE